MNVNPKIKYLLSNISLFALGNLGTRLIIFLLVPLYTNFLNTSEYGTIDLIITISTILAPILILNISEAIMRFALDKDANYNSIMSIGLTVFLFAVVLGLGIVPVINLFLQIKVYSMYVYFYIVTLAGYTLFLCYLRGREMLFEYSVCSIIHTACIAVLNIFLLVVLKKGVKGYFMAYIISNMVAMIYSFYKGKVVNVLRNFSFDKKLFKEMLKYSVVLIPNSLMWWIMNSSDRAMVTNMIGLTANGVYSVSYKIPTILSTLTTIFTQAWCYSAIRENESQDKVKYNNMVYDNMIAIIIILAMGLITVIKPFMRIYVGQNFYEAWKYTPFLIIGFVFMSAGTFLSAQYTVHKDSKGFLFSGMAGAAINIILNFILIPRLGINGAAIATCISYVTVYVYRIIDTRKYLKLKVVRANHIIGLVLLITASLLVYIENIFGQLLLILNLIITVIVFKDIWLSYIHKLKFIKGIGKQK